jgi:galactokinase
MDHLAIAHGGLHAFHFDGTPPESLPLPDAACLLIDTQEPKQTLAVLARSKAARVRLVADPASATSTAERALLDATYASRDVSAEGTEALRRGDLPAVGAALNAHHAFLRDHLQVSTPRLEAVLAAALSHGAYGGKLNGSGGGGTAVVLAPPSRVPAISEAIRAAGGVPHLVQLGASGAHILPA